MKSPLIVFSITLAGLVLTACSTPGDQSIATDQAKITNKSSTSSDPSSVLSSHSPPQPPHTNPNLGARRSQNRQNAAEEADFATAKEKIAELKPKMESEVNAPQTNRPARKPLGVEEAVQPTVLPYKAAPKVTISTISAAADASAGPSAAVGAVGAVAKGVAVNEVPLQWRAPSEPVNRETYDHFDNNPVLRVAENPISTFSIDVDTGSYTNVRRLLRQGQMPVKDAVRVEEFINYFNYEYDTPKSLEHPFNVITELGPTPWNPKTYLLHIGIKAYEVAKEQLPPTNLVFLVDVSGSMQSPDKLQLLVNSLKLLANKMRAEDSISLVVYAGASGVVLEPTSGQNKGKITAALNSLTAGGSTNGGAGIRLAYAKAREAFIENGINRVILATDGDFNVGTVSFEALKNLVEEQRHTGISLTTLGFGSGNYNDRLMEQLADTGNGNYAYIDNLNEAQKVLVNEMSATLQTVAKDVKIQLEFNPALVAEYRLIGYENRALRREDFNNDKIDAGEIGAGHTVTALYEIALIDSNGNSDGTYMDELRYGKKVEHNSQFAGELALLRLRYKQPAEDNSQLLENPVLKSQLIDKLVQTSSRYRFAASVAAFGQILRGGQFTQNYALDDVMELARHARGNDPWGYRSEFLNMVNLAKSLQHS